MRKHFFARTLFLLLLSTFIAGQFLFQSCQTSEQQEESKTTEIEESQDPLFSLLDSSTSGITFNNELQHPFRFSDMIQMETSR